MTDDLAPLALYAVIAAALLGSVLGVFIEKWLFALLAPIPLVVVPMGVLLFLKPFIARHPLLSDQTREALLELADPSIMAQMTIAAAGAALLASLLVVMARAGQGQGAARLSGGRRPASIKKRAAAVTDRTPLQARTDRLAAAPKPAAPPAPAPVYEVEPAVPGSIRASSVAEVGDQTPPKHANRRQSGRRRAILSGFLMMDGDRSSPCRIVDLSDTGARVRLPTVMPLPHKMWLINASEWQAYEVALAWRSEAEAGLRYLSKRNLKDPQTAHDKALHDLCVHLTAR